MSHPKRWIEHGSGATDLERSLLLAADSVEPPQGSQDAVRAALAAHLGLVDTTAAGTVGAAGAGVAGAAAKAVGSASGVLGVLGIVKWSLLGALAAGAVLGTQQVVSLSRSQVPAVPSRSAAYVAPTHNSSGAAPIAMRETVREVSSPANPQKTNGLPPPTPTLESSRGASEANSSLVSPPVTPASPPEAPSASPVPEQNLQQRSNRLREESQRLALVRNALRRGDAASALSHLQQLDRDYPEARLGQEREALAIEALERLGRRAEAQARAAAFLRLWPESPYADVVRRHVR